MRPWQEAPSRPAPDPARQRAQQCAGKVAHGNRVAAEQAALEHEQRFGEPKGAYACRFCGRWHIGRPGS